MYNRKYAPKMFAVIYKGRGPDGWPKFKGATAFRAETLAKECPDSTHLYFGVVLFYTGEAPSVENAERYGELHDIQTVELGLRLVLPRYVCVE